MTAGLVALAAVSVVWLLVSQPMEGDALVVVTADRGLTAADLGGVAGLLVAAWPFARPWFGSKQRLDR
jgi:hypothetical protein